MDEANPPESELSKLEKLKQWTSRQFLTVLLPELRTPVTVIKGYAEILSDETQKEYHPQAIKNILRSVQTLLTLCDGIADYNRLED